MGGSNDPSNLIELTVEEHALAHKQLYEKYGKIEDKIAWLCLSGKTEEAEKLRIKLAQKAFKEKFLTNKKKKEQWKKRISKSLRNKKQSETTKLKRSLSLKKAYQENRHKKGDGKQLIQYNKKNKKLVCKLAAKGRKNSLKWKESVSSEECLLKRSISDPRSKKIMYYTHLYSSIRMAAKNNNISYSKLRTILVNKTNPNIYFV
jgi:hypothetical protein